MSLRWMKLAAILIFLVSGSPSRAEVASSAPHGFEVKIRMPIEAAPTRVYAALVDEVDAWWHPDHRFFSDGRLAIEDFPGGCFCERSGQGRARHLTVLSAEPGVALRLQGALGPLQEMGVTGHMGFRLVAEGEATRLEFYYAVGGYAGQGLAGLAPIVDGVLAGQLARLKSYAETGSPTHP